jgi:16S rRNA processing protein RimM
VGFSVSRDSGPEAGVDERVLVGRVSGVFGTRGWLKIISHTRPSENLLTYKTWSLKCAGQWLEHTVTDSRRHHGGLIVSFTGISDRDHAAGLVRCDIAVARAQLAALADGEFYWSDLIGLRVINTLGQTLGEVSGMLENPAHDVVRLKGDRERLIPFIMGVYIIDVDLLTGEMQVDWHVDD